MSVFVNVEIYVGICCAIDNSPIRYALIQIFVITKSNPSERTCDNLDMEFQIPALDGEDLYNVFFQLRLDHPEIFWATGIHVHYQSYKRTNTGYDSNIGYIWRQHTK